MDLKEIDKLIDKLIAKGVTEFELEKDGFRIRICKNQPVVNNSPSQQAAGVPVLTPEGPSSEGTPEEGPSGGGEPTPGSNNHHIIASPMVGTFYRAPSPGATPYVELGDEVTKGQVCCIVEAMKLMNEIAVDIDGVILVIHVDNAQPVEYGEPLFTIEKLT